ncbi:hypothetical protein [Bradyrhizobium sp. BR13661]|jgi:hypothetical protein|uniref:hypothetical protein n=1 Tax=Bradyrhizobium sp. BR13661 TaxID=2940622 RepID=UPI002472E8E7|nr:hypothetical protein [Bradyrhizobium sp. BR13661]MDH6260271.1 hypothetical protein [Bradyrhizobium sp. BR13661]
MTLVVAHAEPDICFMVGDTLLSHEHFTLKGDIGPVNGEFHSLKIQIVTGELAIGFAGNFDAAYSAVSALKLAIAAEPVLDPTEWIASRNILDADFLVLKNAAKKELFVIERGEVRQAINAHIGDTDEWNRFLQLKKEYSGAAERFSVEEDGRVLRSDPVTCGEKEFSVASDAMEALCWDCVGRKQPTVGAISGCVVRVVDARISRQLEYLQAVEDSHFPWEPAGGFAILASNEIERGIGIYFGVGQRGFILPVGGQPPCVGSTASTLKAFVEEARSKFGMRLTGGTWGETS